MIPYKRLSLFAGHYGSGKTNIAINFAKYIKSFEQNVAIADLDIVNPYFRTKDSEAELTKAGIELVVSQFAGTNVDAPALPKEIYSVISDKSKYCVLDIGGDDRGALALGRYIPDITSANDYEFYFVVNKARPLTRTPGDTIEIMHEIENAAGLRFTAIINNSNIGPDTTADYIKQSAGYAKEICKITGLPLAFTAVNKILYDNSEYETAVFPLDIQKLYYQFTEEENG